MSCNHEQTGNDPNRLQQRITAGLTKLGLALKHQSWQAAGGRGLSPAQAQILVLLGERTAMRPSELADRLAVKLPTISESVRSLVEKGLVEKSTDPRDARAVLLQLTDAGREHAREAAGWPDFLASAVDAMSEQEQEVFYAGLLKMMLTLEQRGQIPLSGMCLSCSHFQSDVHETPDAPHHCNRRDAALGARELRLDCTGHAPNGDKD